MSKLKHAWFWLISEKKYADKTDIERACEDLSMQTKVPDKTLNHNSFEFHCYWYSFRTARNSMVESRLPKPIATDENYLDFWFIW